MREGTTDIRTPVKFLLTLQLQQDEPRYLGADFGVANINQYPILNQREAQKELEIPFQKSCGGDDLCESKLQVRIPENSRFLKSFKILIFLTTGPPVLAYIKIPGHVP